MRVFKTNPFRLGPIALAAAVALAAASSPAHAGLVFDFTFDSSIATDFGAGGAALIESDLTAVANTYSALYDNNVTLNFDITANTTPGALAASLPTYDQSAIYSYAQIGAALRANPSLPSANMLPRNDPALSAGGPPALAAKDGVTPGYILPTAESKALGLTVANPAASDGTIYIGADLTGTIGAAGWDLNGTTTPAPGTYSFVNAAEHEIAELMGRTTQLSNPGWPWNGPMDLLRCTATGPNGAGVINMDPKATGAYFSTDGCVTDTKNYNAPNANGADIQDWASSGTPDPYDAYGTPGAFAVLSTADQLVMNSLGWTSPTSSDPISTPEPMSMAIILPGVFSVIGLRKRRRQAAVG